MSIASSNTAGSYVTNGTKIMPLYWVTIIGNVLEHYDEALYGFLIPFLAPLFFPHSDPIYSLLAAYAILPLALLSKPLGAYVFGRIGDRWGRKRSLSITLLGMAFATVGVGCLPTFEEAGWVASALLSFGRLVQNFFVAGEATGGVLYLLENTEKRKRGFVSSLFDASGIVGIMLAALAASLVGELHWRWLFWGGGICGLFGVIIRWTAVDAGEQGFATSTNVHPCPPSSTVVHCRPPLPWQWRSSDWVPVMAIAAVSGFSYANYYLLSSFLNGFLPLVSRVSSQEALSLNALLHLLDLLLLPCFGWLSMRVANDKLMLVAIGLAVCLAHPLFFALDGADTWVAGGVRIALTILGVCLAAPYHAWAMEAAPVQRRFTVCAVGSAIGSQLIGAPIPVISLWLYHTTGWVASPAIPLIATALLAGAAILYLRQRSNVRPPPVLCPYPCVS